MSACPICMETFRHPIILPCGHTFCKECIIDWAAKCAEETTKDLNKYKGDGPSNSVSPDTVRCPSCQEIHKIPEGGASSFIRNYALSYMGTLCGWCDEETAKMRCCECNMWLCTSCKENHHDAVKKKKGHRILQAHEVSEADEKGKYQICYKHEGKPMELFCTVCSEACCLTGGATEHKMHECVALKQKFDVFYEEKTLFLQSLDNSVREMDNIHDKMKTYRQMREKNKEFIKIEIEKRKRKFIETIEIAAEREKKLVDDDYEIDMGILQKEFEDVAREIETVKKRKEKLEEELKTIGPGNIHMKEDGFRKMATLNMDKTDIFPSSKLHKIILLNEKELEMDTVKGLIGKRMKVTKSKKPCLVEEIDTLAPGDTASPSLTDVSLMNGCIVVADNIYGNCNVKVFSNSGSLLSISDEKLIKNPTRIGKIPEDEDHILVGDYNSCLNSWGIKSGSLSFPIGLSLIKVRGISITKHETSAVIVVVHNDPNLMELIHPTQRTTIKQYDLGKYEPWFVAGNVGHDLVAISSGYNILRTYKEKQVIWEVGKNVIKNTCGVSMTNLKQVLVADCELSSVLLFSETGELLRNLLTKKDGILSPHGLDFDEERHLLAVTEKGSHKVKLYLCWL